MGFYYSDDPVRDAERHAEEQDKMMERLPVCSICSYPIQSEYFFRIAGNNVCPVCLDDHYRKRTEDYIS